MLPPSSTLALFSLFFSTHFSPSFGPWIPFQFGDTPLKAVDPGIHDLTEKEKHRQCRCINLISLENFTSFAVTKALGSALTNKYFEGMPGNRYYGGNEYVDEIENLRESRALQAE